MKLNFLKKIAAVIYRFLPIFLIGLQLVYCVILFLWTWDDVDPLTSKVLQLSFLFLLLAGSACFAFLYFVRKGRTTFIEFLESVASQNNPFLFSFLLLGVTTLLCKVHPRWVYLADSLLFFIMGFFYLKFVLIDVERNTEKLLSLGLVWFLGGNAFIGLSFKIATTDVNILTLTWTFYFSIILFAIASLVYLSFNYWKKVPASIPAPWYFDPKTPVDSIDMLPNFSCIFNLNSTDYPIRIPPSWIVGNAFKKFLIQGEGRTNFNVEYYKIDKNNDKKYYGWVFSTINENNKKNVFIDWSKSFLENDINQGQRITISCIK